MGELKISRKAYASLRVLAMLDELSTPFADKTCKFVASRGVESDYTS
jgi:hypothetical protein